MQARRALRILSTSPGANPTADTIYELVLEATGDERAALRSRSLRLDAELRAGGMPG